MLEKDKSIVLTIRGKGLWLLIKQLKVEKNTAKNTTEVRALIGLAAITVVALGVKKTIGTNSLCVTARRKKISENTSKKWTDCGRLLS